MHSCMLLVYFTCASWLAVVDAADSVLYPYGTFSDTKMGCPNDDLPYGLITSERGFTLFDKTIKDFYISVNGFLGDVPADSWVPQRFPLRKSNQLPACSSPRCLYDYYDAVGDAEVLEELKNANKDPDPCLHGRNLTRNSGVGTFQYYPFDYTYSEYKHNCLGYEMDATTDLPSWMIALFWHDIDIRVGNGAFYYRETTDSTILTQAKEDVARLKQGNGRGARTWVPGWAFVITFEDVTFFNGQHYNYPSNYMQLVIATDGTDTYGIYNFDSMDWSGGQIGFDSGDGKNFCALQKSRSDKVSDVVKSSNVDVDGRWVIYFGKGYDKDICEPRRDYLPSCVCDPGWEGVLCGSSVDDCKSQPCYNGATCIDGHITFTCECAFGYMDTLCNVTDYCAPVTCQYDGVCINKANDFECICTEPASSGRTCQVYDHCHYKPCNNGGNCSNNANDTTGYSCSCPSVYKGHDCEVLDHCLINDCQNGASCKNNTAGFECKCADGWTDRACTIVNYCHGNQCKNAAQCLNHATNYSCSCADGFLGEYCEIIDHCFNVTCQNNGKCSNKPEIGQFKCDCTVGWLGTYCHKVDHCVNATCTGNTRCLNGESSYTCICKDGWLGQDCNGIDYCYYNATQCLNGATCSNRQDGINCTCTRNYTGQFCEIFDHCGQTYNNCSGNSDCVNTNSGYRCDCHTDWYGDYCYLDDPCKSSPCYNGGRCRFFGSRKVYRCVCQKGWKGPRCQTVDIRSSAKASKQTADGASASGIIGAVAGVVGAIAAAAVIYALVKRLKKKQTDKVSPEPDGVSVVSFDPPQYSGKQAMVTGHT